MRQKGQGNGYGRMEGEETEKWADRYSSGTWGPLGTHLLVCTIHCLAQRKQAPDCLSLMIIDQAEILTRYGFMN